MQGLSLKTKHPLGRIQPCTPHGRRRGSSLSFLSQVPENPLRSTAVLTSNQLSLYITAQRSLMPRPTLSFSKWWPGISTRNESSTFRIMPLTTNRVMYGSGLRTTENGSRCLTFRPIHQSTMPRSASGITPASRAHTIIILRVMMNCWILCSLSSPICKRTQDSFKVTSPLSYN